MIPFFLGDEKQWVLSILKGQCFACVEKNHKLQALESLITM